MNQLPSTALQKFLMKLITMFQKTVSRGRFFLQTSPSSLICSEVGDRSESSWWKPHIWLWLQATIWMNEPPNSSSETSHETDYHDSKTASPGRFFFETSLKYPDILRSRVAVRIIIMKTSHLTMITSNHLNESTSKHSSSEISHETDYDVSKNCFAG